MELRKFINEKFAVAGVIEALLLVALVSVILSTIQLVYIPEIMEQKEADHMDEIENQFSQLKSVIETQSLMGVMGEGTDNPIMYTYMSSPITLGSKELPYFVTNKALGEIFITDQDDTNSIIKIVGNPVSNDIPLTSIKYVAYNSYYIDQKYVLEGGGIIINQTEGEVMKVKPAITKENSTTTNIYWSIPIIVGTPGKNYTYGYKNCFVYTNYSSNDPTFTSDLDWTQSSHHIKIETLYLDAWNLSLNEFFEDEINNNYVKIYKYQSGPTEYVRIEPDNKNIHIEVEIVYIGTQIGPGVVKY